MKAERWRQVSSIFNDVVQLKLHERAAILDRACAHDPSLRKEVESLLGSCEEAQTFLEPPAQLQTHSLIGKILGSYEVKALIGAGGMGAVYRAWDSKLKRDVAIKVLPDEVSRDADSLSRFQREAEILASLSHPQIAAIYDIASFETVRFLVLELVEGETLAERIERGPIPIEEALPMARQIAEALEAAHEKGIIHRDLKPANIKIARDGHIKVLDFGLAKVRKLASAPELANSPTLMTPTVPGMILGTPAYMSPEQAKGQDADRRSDVWAFGCVLYEMLTGLRLFKGATVGEILEAVFKVEPDWSRLPKETPTAIRKLLQRCLRKEAKSRLQDMGDLRIEIDEAHDEQSEPVSRARRGVRSRMGWIAAGGIAVAGIALALPYLRQSTEIPGLRLEIATPAEADPVSWDLSPDGKWVVYVAPSEGKPHLWLRLLEYSLDASLDASNERPLAGTEDARFPFWSPDNRSIGFIGGQTLKRIDIASGTLTNLAAAANASRGTWGADDVILFGGSGAAIRRVPASGDGPVTAALELQPGQFQHTSPEFLPQSPRFLFYAPGEKPGIYLGSLDSPNVSRVTSADSAGKFLSPGWLFFIRQGKLLAQRLNVEMKTLTGDPITIASITTGDDVAFSVSPSGRIGYRAWNNGSSQLLWLDHSGKPLSVAATGTGLPELSSDGRRIATSRSGDLLLIDLDRGTQRFTFDPNSDGTPIWSRDGNRIVFYSNRSGTFRLYEKASNDPAAKETRLLNALAPKDSSETPMDWSADGRFLLYQYRESQAGGSKLWVLPMDGSQKPRPFLEGPSQESWGQFSPDSQWVAYESNESGQANVYVRRLEGSDVWEITEKGGVQPRWSADGKELYYLADGYLMAVPIEIRERTIVRRPAKPLFPAVVVTRRYGYDQQYDVAPDGRFLMFVPPRQESTTAPITLLTNWRAPSIH